MISDPTLRSGAEREHGRARRASGMPRPATDRMGEPRLLERLAQARPLTILRAPSGFGKSSIVAQWLRTSVADSADVVWLSSDVGGWGADDPAGTFWGALASRLAELAPPSRRGTAADARAAVADLLRARDRPVFVVLDRYSQMVPGHPEIDRALTELLHICENFFLVVCTREVSSLEVVGAAIVDSLVLRPADLALAPRDVLALAGRHDLELTEGEAEALCEHTGGWPALVRVILVGSAAARPSTGRATIRLDAGTWFLRTAWQEFDTPGLQDFILQTSVFSVLTEGLLGEIMPGRSCAAYLDALLAAGLMHIEHRGGEQVYRHLPAVRLEAATRLREQDPERYRELCVLAARRAEAAGDHVAALAHLATAGCWGALGELVERRWTVLLTSDADTLAGVLRAVPDDVVAGSAHLLAARDYVLDLDEDAEQPWRHDHPLGAVLGPMLGLLTAGDEQGELSGRPRGYDALTETVRRALPGVLCEWGVSRTLAVDLPGALRAFRDAYAVAESCEMPSMARRAALGASMVETLGGDVSAALVWTGRYDDAAARDLEQPPPLLEPVARIMRQVIAISTLDPFDAAAMLEAPLDRSHGGLWVLGLLVKTQVALVTGRVSGLADELDDAARVVSRDTELRMLAPLVACARVDLLLSLGQVLRARAVVERMADGLQTVEVARARTAWLGGNHALAAQICERVLRAGATTVRVRVALLAIRAAAQHARGQRAEAVRLLQSAVQDVRSSGLYSALAYVPRSLLEDLCDDVTGIDGVLDRLDALGLEHEVFPAPSTLAELSERELEVLEALARAGSVSGVAKALFVTANTVKTHLRSIYRKLGTHSAAETVQRAVEFGLIEAPVSARLSR